LIDANNFCNSDLLKKIMLYISEDTMQKACRIISNPLGPSSVLISKMFG